MKKSTDVFCIGASAAAGAAAVASRRWYPEKKVTCVRNVSYTVVPCGIPYIYGYLGGSVEKNKIPDELLTGKGIELLTDNVIDVDIRGKVVKLEGGDEYSYEKLVFGTGSHPFVPPIGGLDLKNVFTVKKDPKYLEEIGKALEGANDVVVIGGGFIGVEMAEQIKMKGIPNVTIVELLPHCLLLACEEEMAIRAEEELRKLGVNIILNASAKNIVGNGKAEAVELSTGQKVKADVVIIGIGAAAEVDLAEKVGLKVDRKMGIIVDRYMRTSEKDVFACGDCATKPSFITGNIVPIRLASVACSEGIIAGSNLYKLNRQTLGAVGAFATKIGNLCIGAAGLSTKMCKDNGIDYYTGEIQAPDRHPAGLPGCTMNMKVKLIFRKSDNKIIGGHVAGGMGAADMANIISVAIQSGLTSDELAVRQIATHPLLTGSPLVTHVMWAAEDGVLNKNKQ